ncbi:MAG: dUTP diphosphatase [Candidatus Sumerlaeia bacterium]|nr:dUTP diphosphatase [Candidatus Sumerlaeia bacterium]
MSSSPVPVPIALLPHGEGLPLPAYQTAGAAGADLLAAVAEPLVIGPGALALVPTGLVFAIPDGYELQIRPRSGLAARHRIGLLNSPGTIDSDYRGELMVVVMNFGPEPFTVRRGDRIAQAVLAPVVRAEWRVTPEADLPATARGAGGFGSTGRS